VKNNWFFSFVFSKAQYYFVQEFNFTDSAISRWLDNPPNSLNFVWNLNTAIIQKNNCNLSYSDSNFAGYWNNCFSHIFEQKREKGKWVWKNDKSQWQKKNAINSKGIKQSNFEMNFVHWFWVNTKKPFVFAKNWCFQIPFWAPRGGYKDNIRINMIFLTNIKPIHIKLQDILNNTR